MEADYSGYLGHIPSFSACATNYTEAMLFLNKQCDTCGSIVWVC